MLAKAEPDFHFYLVLISSQENRTACMNTASDTATILIYHVKGTVGIFYPYGCHDILSFQAAYRFHHEHP